MCKEIKLSAETFGVKLVCQILSGKICEAYAGRDVRVKVIHRQNEGLSEARDTGILGAVGEYCPFVDSDDYIAEDYIEYLFNETV